MMGARMTRIGRIYADFYPACGVMNWPQIAQICGKKTFAAGE